MSTKLAIVVSHPTQYYSPWFRHIATRDGVDVRVFYLWDFGIAAQRDHLFERDIVWDIPLLDGYAHEFVANVSRSPGTHAFMGLYNPGLRRSLAQFGPDAVLVYGHGWRAMCDLIAHRGYSKASLLYRGDSHLLGPTRKGLRHSVWAAITRKLFRRCDHFLAVGSANSDYFVEHGVSREAITIVPHCVDNARFILASHDQAGRALRAKLGIPFEAVVYLFAGKLEEKKRPGDVVWAFKQLARNDCHLILAGSGPLEAELRGMAGGDRRIHFLGFQNQSHMPEVYSAADVLVLPSYGRHETWGLCVNEAMNCGCGILVSDHVGCAADLVNQKGTGLVFRAGDRSALQQSMVYACDNRAVVASWQQKGQEVVAGLSYEYAAERLLHVLSCVAGATRCAHS